MNELLTQMQLDKEFTKGHIIKLLKELRCLRLVPEDRIKIDSKIIDLWNKVKPQDLELVSNDEGAGE